MRNFSSAVIALVLVVCIVLPSGIVASDDIPYVKGEMVTVYDCNYSSAGNPRISGSKLFFMTGTNNNLDPKISECFIYDIDKEEYSLIHTAKPNTSISGGYSWKTCITEGYVFWQLWDKNPETNEKNIFGNLTNLETNENTRFLLDTLDPRVGISNDELYINKRNKERKFSTLYGYDLEKPSGRKNKISTLIDYSNCDTPIVSGNRVAFSKMNPNKSTDIFIYDSRTKETIRVTDEENMTYSDKYSLQGDYLYYYSKSTQITCYDINSRERKIVFSYKIENKRDAVRLISNPNSDYLLLDNTKANGNTYIDGNFENYLLLYDPVTEESKEIFISDTFEMMGVYNLPFPYRRLSEGKKVIFQKPGEYRSIYIYDGEKDSIAKIDLEQKYRWFVSDYNIYGNTVVWTERFHGKRPDGSYPQRLMIFKLAD